MDKKDSVSLFFMTQRSIWRSVKIIWSLTQATEDLSHKDVKIKRFWQKRALLTAFPFTAGHKYTVCGCLVICFRKDFIIIGEAGPEAIL